jgi:DNA (cytosine-5)-methyltransferase 1
MLKAAGVEGAEEVLDGGIQQALGIAFGDRKFDANSLLDGFLIGATMGGGTNLISKSPSLIGLSSDMLTTIKITDELSKIQGALSDPSLSDVERDLLTNRARVANNEIRRAKNNAAIFFQNYTPEDLQETMTLNSEIRRQVDNMPSFKTSEAKSAAIQSVKDSVARLQQIESKYDSQKKQQVQGAVQEGAQPGGVPVEGAGTAATAPGGVLQDVSQTQQEQVAQQRTEEASALNVKPRLKKMKVTAKNAPGAYKMMMDALSNYTDEFLQQNKTDRASVERGIKSLFDVISSLDAKGRTVEIDVMGSIDEANKLFGFEINEVDGKFEVSSKIPGANRVFDTKEGADAYTKRVLYRGVNMMSDGGDVKISVLLPAMLDNTGYHEALHSLEVLDEDSVGKLVKGLKDALKKLPVLDKRMADFVKDYGDKLKDSEFLAELGSMISTGDISVEVRESVIKTIAKSFLDFFKRVTGSSVDTSPTAEQLASTFIDIAEKLGRGEKQAPYRKVRGKGEESGAVDISKGEVSGPRRQLQKPTESTEYGEGPMFSIDGKTKFFHASDQKRRGRLKKSTALQFGSAIYFSTSKKRVMGEFGDNVTEVELDLKNPVYTNTKQWSEVEELAIKLADDDYGRRKNLKLEEDETYFHFTLGDFAEIPSRFISQAAEQLGYDAIVDRNSHNYENEIAVLNEAAIIYEEDTPKFQKPTEGGAYGRGVAEYNELKDFFGGIEPNKNRLFFADATNDFYIGGSNRSDVVLTIDEADFWLTEGPDGYVTIDDFQVSKDKLGTGKGKFALSKLTEYADKNGITLIGEPLAQAERGGRSEKRGLPQKQLIEFYKRNGFEKISKDTLSKNRTAENNYLERKPRNIGDFSAESPDIRFQKPTGKGAKNFDKWVGGNRLVTAQELQDVKSGEPIVVRAYHGTTNDFYEFDSSVKGNIEGHLGKLNYFTTDFQDASANYQSTRADLTNRIESRAEEIESFLEDEFDDFYKSKKELSKAYGYTANQLTALGSFSALAKDIAKKELQGGEERVLDVYIKLNNPVVLGNYYNKTWVDVINLSKSDLDEAAVEIADENDISVDEAKSDYESDIRQRAIENTGVESVHVKALERALKSNNYDIFYRGDLVSNIIGDDYFEESIELSAFENQMRKAGIDVNDEGEYAVGQVIADFFKNLGYDGIVLTDVSSRFRNMGLGGNTSHIHVFDEYANQIKLADGSNVTFGETRDIRFQRTSGDEISTDDFTALSKRLNKFFKGNVKIVDADTFEKESEKFTGEKLDLKSYDGNVYGAVLPNGVMFINGLDVNSLLHEHTHLFNQVVMKVNPKLWNSIKEAVKKTTEWSQVKRNPLYSNLKTDDEVADEVFSKIVGNAAKNGWQKYTNQSIYQNIKALAQKFYNTILDLFGVDYYKGMSASGLADLTLTELMGGVSTTPYQVDAKINELMSKLLKGTKYLDQLRFNIDPNSRKKFEKALGEKDGRALYEIFGNVQDPSKLIDFAKSKFPIKGTLSSIAKRPIKGDNGFVINNGNFGSIVVYKDYEKYLNEELKQVVDKATLDPQDLLNEVGYTLFNPRNLSDARNSFLHYYKKGHNICTLNPGSDRFSGSFVTFIVRNDADQTPSAEDLTQDNLTDEWRKYLEKNGRKNSDGTYNLNGLKPNALDPYSTSVISLQINKSNGSTKEISRYNHQISSPDNIFSRDFDNLIEGLSDAMFKKFGVEKNTKQSTTRMPNGVIQDANGAYYNYIYETNGVYYGDGYYLENGVATLLDRGSERMVDGWVISNRGDGTATNIDRTTRGFLYGDVKKVNYIKGDEISLTTENGNFVFEVKNGAVVRLIDFPKKWRLDKLNDFYAGLQSGLEYDKNGNLTLPELYFIQSVYIQYSYINMLWADDIIGISSFAHFESTKIQYLGNLQYIKGYANFRGSQVKSLGELKYIGRADFTGSQVQSLGELKYIGRDARFDDSQVKSLGELKYIGGIARFDDSQIQSLGELKYIGGDADFRNSQIQSLGELKYIGDDARFDNSQVQSLGSLKYIGGNAIFRDSQIQSLGELKYIKGGASFRSSQVQSLGGLKYIGGSATFTGSQVQSLGELKYIGDDVDFIDSQVHSLGKLKYISGYADFSNSQVKSLGELRYIGGDADFRNSQVQSLGELRYIGGIATYFNSPIDSKAIEDIQRKSNDSTGEIILRDANDFKESIEREFEQFAKEVGEEFTESQPKFQRIATFFSGAGTLEAAMTDPTSVMAVEYTPDYIKAYNEAFNTDYKARDVLDIDPQEVIDSNPDIFHASPTCKSFSKARIGTREAKEMDIKSAESVARVIRDAKPPVVTIENVPDYKGSLPYDKIISALKDSGYKYDEGIYNAADFGGIQQRRRLIIRAALNVDLPAIPDKKKPGDWFKALEPMIDSAPDSAFTGKSGDENWEVKRLLDMIKSGRLSADKPIITMGGSTDSGIASAANAGGPAPTLTSSSKQIPRIIMPDGRIKRVTPDMMRVLMGLPESYRIPDDWKTAKEVLGNGIDGNITRALIEPLSKKSEEFSKSQPKFQTPIDEAFDRQQTFIDEMSKKRGVLRNLNPRLLDRASPLKKKLIDANLKNARDLFVAQAGAGSRAKMFIDENFGPIYNGLNKQNTEYLDKIIQLRRIIQIDEDFDSKGKPRIKHTADKYNRPINKEVAEKNLVDFESILGSALYNDLIRRSELYFDSYKKLLSIMRESGLITQELYDSLKSLLYQPRKFLDQFVSFDDGDTVIDIKDLALNEYQIKTLQNGSDSEIMMNSKLLLAFSAKSVFSRAARNKTYTAISEATKDPNNNGWISDKELKNFEPVNYFVDGVREQFFIRGDFKKQLYDSTRHLISPAAANIIRMLSGSAILKSFATQVNPLFALKNFPRDILHVAMFTNAYGNNLYSSIFRISRDAFKGMHDKMSKSADFKEWLDYGGGMDFLSTEGFESRSIRDGVYTKVRDALSTFGEYSEVGVRLAVYKKTRDELVDKFIKDNGRTPNKDESDSIKTEAAVASREIIDFAQGGSWAKAGENFIPYLNAAIQGFRVATNYIVKNPKNFAVKASQLALAVGMIMFYNSLMADDDDWEGISDGEKMRNFIIFLPLKDKDGNRYYLKIAKTQQSILFSTMFEIASAKILNEVMNPDGDDKVAKKYMMYGDRNYNAVRDGITSFLPKNPLEVKKELTSAIPLINAISAIDNHDTFFNSKVSYDYQKMPAMYEDVLDPDVPYFYKALSQSMYPVIQLGPKRMETAVGKITTGAETSIIVAGAYHLLDNISRKVADVKTDELNIGEVPSDNPKLKAISSLFSPLKGVVKSVNPGIKKYQYEDDLNSISLRGAATVETIKNASRNLGEKYYDAVRGEGDLTKDEVISQVNEYKDMLLKSGVQPSQVKVFIESFKMSAKSNPKTNWEAGYYDIMYSPSSEATVGIISKLKGSNLTDDELKEYFINYKKSTGYRIKNVGEVYSLYRKSRDKK